MSHRCLTARMAQLFVIDAGPANTKNRGDWRGHFNLMLAF